MEILPEHMGTFFLLGESCSVGFNIKQIIDLGMRLLDFQKYSKSIMLGIRLDNKQDNYNMFWYAPMVSRKFREKN